MHTRTYADPSVKAFAGKFVWVLIDPSVSTANEDLVKKYTEKVKADLGASLSLPTAVFMENNGKLIKAATGMVEAKDFVALMKGILGE